MRRYFGAIRPHLAAIIIFSLTLNCLALASPLYTLQLYDRVLASRSPETLLSLTAIVVVLIAAMSALDALRGRLLVRIGSTLHQNASPRVYRAIMQRAAENPKEQSRDAHKDLHDVRSFVSGLGLSAFIDAPWSIVFMVIIFAIHPLLGIVVLTGAVLLISLAFIAEGRSRPLVQDARRSTLEAERRMSENLRNLDVSRAMDMEARAHARWQLRQQEAVWLQDTQSEFLGSIGATSRSIRILMQIAVMGVGAWLALNQEITAGIMIAASLMASRALAPVDQALGAWKGFTSARLAFARLDQLLSATQDREEGTRLPAPTPQLTAEALVGGAPGSEAPTIRGISLLLEGGITVAIAGQSAAGKSTLLKLLVGIWPSSSGTVRLGNIQIDRLNASGLGEHIGYLPQEIELFEGTILENIARLSSENPDRAIKAAQLAGIHDMILRLPDAYDTVVGSGGITLSGGQKQRIALARALYGDPTLVVLDEPDAHLDEAGVASLVRAIRTLKQNGQIVLVATHRPQMMAAMDRLAVLRDGKVERFGPSGELLANLRGQAPLKSESKILGDPNSGGTLKLVGATNE